MSYLGKRKWRFGKTELKNRTEKHQRETMRVLLDSGFKTQYTEEEKREKILEVSKDFYKAKIGIKTDLKDFRPIDKHGTY